MSEDFTTKTVRINSIDKHFVYIDPSRQYNDNPATPDGTTPNTSWYNLPAELRDDEIYLIRKTYAHYVSLTNTNINNSTLTSLTIWGMPSQGEKHWDDLPDSLKASAWATDADINFRSTLAVDCGDYSGTRITLSQLKYLEFYNFRFLAVRNGNSDHNGLCMKIANANGCDIRLEKMEFDGARRETKEGNIYYNTYKDMTSRVHWAGCRWINANNNSSQVAANSCVVRDTVFNLTGNDYGIQLGYCLNAEISNVLVNLIASEHHDTDRSNARCILVNGRRNKVRVISHLQVRDLFARLFYNVPKESSYYETYRHRFGSILYVEDMVVDLKNVDIRFADAADQYGVLPQDKTHDMYFSARKLIYCRAFQGSRFEHIVANMGTYMDLCNNSILIVECESIGDNEYYRQGENRFGQYTIVKDVTIDVQNITGTDSETGEITSVGSIGESSSDLMRNGLTNDSYTPALRIEKTTDSSSYRSSDDILLQNLNLTVYRGYALAAKGCMLDLGDRTIYGMVSLAGCVGKIRSIVSYGVQKILRDAYSNLVYIHTLQCNRNLPGSEYANQPAVSFGNSGYEYESSYINSNILITESNTKCFDTTPKNCDYECLYVCTNNQNTGNYTCRNGATLCNTWSVYRTGSDNQCSLRVENVSYEHSDTPLHIGGAPFKGITKHVDQGNHTVKLHVTTYGYNHPEEIKNHLFLKIKRADGSIVTDFEGNWSRDTVSEWVNIDGGTAFVLEIPISITEAEGEDLEFEYTFNWYYVDAATFIDPYPVIEATA